MGNVRYKKVSDSLAKLTQPDEYTGRISIGLEKNIGEFYYLNINDLLPFKNQARKYFPQEEIENLASSIKLHGIRHPLTVIPHEGVKGKFEVISGERRLRAAKLLNMQTVPCILLKDVSLADEIAIIENLHRQDLHPVELGMALCAMLDSGIFSSQQELALKLSVSKATISEHMQYGVLDKDTREYLIEHNITSRDVLRKLIKAEGDKEKIEKILGKKDDKNLRSFSVIRIMSSNGQFQLQLKGIKKLAPQDRITLKKELNKIIEQLM